MSDPSEAGFSALWARLETSAATDGARWWLIRCRATPGRSLLAAREPDTGRRALLLPLEKAPPPARRQWPHLSALSPISVMIDDSPHIGVILNEPRFTDVFDSLAVDLARRVEDAVDAEDAAIALLRQLHRWQLFLTATTQGLDPESQRGLWGELHLLLQTFEPELGPQAVAGWKGPQASHQDFRYAGAWIEVKTTLAKQPQTVRIASERQLDDTHAPALFLHVLTLEAVEGGSETLPALVAQARARFGAWPETLERFEDALLAARYLDQHAPRYTGLGYAVRHTDTFRVAAGFPRIIEQDLAPGVGDASYRLSLAACAAFSDTLQTLVEILKTSTTPN